MDIRKRLAALDGLSRKPEKEQKSKQSVLGSGHAYEPSLMAELQLQPIETKAGTVWVRDYTDPIDFPEGPLPDFREVIAGAHLVTPTLDELLFLDTETTGLAGGTGTLAFLVGCSWFRDGLFHTRQLFLPGPGMESAILQEIHNLSQDFSVVVSFNGGSFDLPLLRTRALMNRVPNPLDHLVSWDLLMAGRRFWGRMLENCKQQTLEKHICGIKRSGADIEGALIPQTWFDFLDSGKTTDLVKVLYHNHRDMVGMGNLLGKIVLQTSLLLQMESNIPKGIWQEFWALGRICEKKKKQSAAEYWLSSALKILPDTVLDTESLIPLFQDTIRVMKRGGDWKEVQSVMDRAFALGIDGPWLHREAAILFEHRRVDLSQALVYALLAEDPHRVARLQRKLSSGRQAP